MSQRVESRSNLLAIVSIVVAVLGALWSSIGAFYPGTALGVVAVAMAVVARQRAPEGQTVLPTVGLLAGLLVIAAGIALAVVDAG